MLRADDGGASANPFVMQFQADLLTMPVEVPEMVEITALGAAQLAGLTVGFWDSQDQVAAQRRVGQRYEPRIPPEEMDRLYAGWQRATERARNWETPG
ncbi:MAG: hypothetical protein BZY75_02720 [SAR202 cluster bacterium Io17-Chloro-G7]|nr:MAG: hypothetical protein BZY75_02720 [SAR202 cluster bacterium Io17-Chloro-G7]